MASKAKSSSKKQNKNKASISNSYKSEDLLSYYRKMVEIRRFEERSGQLYGMGLIGGFCHLYIGQEAVVTGLSAVQNKEVDTVITAYRDHGHMLACDMDPRGVMAELTGRIGGYSRGKGGSMHMFSSEKRFFGGHGIVGASSALGTGLAFAHKYKKDGGVCFAYMGDGAANQGQFFESMNMAQLWGLPILYVIENNEYAMGTAVSRHAANGEKMYERGASFGIPGEPVDGMNVLAVKEAAEKAVDYIRTNSKPYVLEVRTYRYRGHSMSDPATYRSKDEVNDIRTNRDPIETIKDFILSGKYATEDDLKAIDDEIKEIMKDAVEFAKESPEPDPSELYTDVLLEA